MELSEKGMPEISGADIRNTEDRELLSISGLDQFRRLQLLNIKYGRTVIDEAELKGSKWVFNELPVINMCAGNMFEIITATVSSNILTIQGIDRLTVTGRNYTVSCTDNEGNRYQAELSEYAGADIQGYMDDLAVAGERFRFDIPLDAGENGRRKDLTLTFIYSCEGSGEVELTPVYSRYLGLPRDIRNAYCITDGYLLQKRGRKLVIAGDSGKDRLTAEARLTYEMIRKKGPGWISNRSAELRHRKYIRNCSLKDQVAFLSARSTDRLLGNMEMVYNGLDLPKVSFARLKMVSDAEAMKKAERIAAESKVIVTDDYLHLLRTYRKKPGQHIVQLWHATGAGKKFGQDGSDLFPPLDALFHRDYDAVTVSSEQIRRYYAQAFDIPVERITASGVARTDIFFDDQYSLKAKERVLALHPEFKGKTVIMYAPTFRDLPGISRSRFEPELDFGHLLAELGERAIVAVCPHPVMTEPVVKGSYNNITEVRDISSTDMMFVSDIMITDYSSVMFEYALLGKPMAFFCYDYDSYERDFYMDFDSELPGPLLKSQEELEKYLTGYLESSTIRAETGEATTAEQGYEEFLDKYLGACDGHSTERICRLIEKLYYTE